MLLCSSKGFTVFGCCLWFELFTLPSFVALNHFWNGESCPTWLTTTEEDVTSFNQFSVCFMENSVANECTIHPWHHVFHSWLNHLHPFRCMLSNTEHLWWMPLGLDHQEWWDSDLPGRSHLCTARHPLHRCPLLWLKPCLTHTGSPLESWGSTASLQHWYKHMLIRTHIYTARWLKIMLRDKWCTQNRTVF